MNTLKNIIKSIRRKNLIKRVVILLISLFVSALTFNFFERPIQLVTGGSSGLAILAEYLFEWNPSTVIFILSLVLLIFSFFLLGFEATSGAILATFIYPYFVRLTSNWSNVIPIDTSDMIIISIFIGIFSGITNGLVYKNGFNNGGLSIISQILFKYQKISISTTSFVLNVVIVLTGGFFFGWQNVMYAVIILYINSIVVNRVLVGVSRNKSVFIITNKEEAVKKYVLNNLGHGITKLEVKGGKTFKQRYILMTVISTKDYFKLKEGVKLIDNRVFFIVTDSYQVSGGF